MRYLNILSAGFTSPNGRAFLMPLVVHRHQLRALGISIKVYTKVIPSLFDCNYLVIDSKYYGPKWQNERDEILAEVTRFSENVDKIIYANISDSSTWDHAYLLPYVDAYWKSQLLCDRDIYLRPLYGNRIFTDYYHQAYGVVDDTPEYSSPVQDPALLDKLFVCWNSGLADYSLYGPLRMALYEKIPCSFLLKYPNDFTPVSSTRSRLTSLRVGTNYARATVSKQRRMMVELLGDRLEAQKVSRRAYMEELRTSRVVVSPFGLGEITLRDFEIFKAGALMLKPDMSHMETWPNFYEDNQTMVTHRWDLSDFDEKLDRILSNFSDYMEIAEESQNRYRRHTCGPEAGGLFAHHLDDLLKKSE